MEINFMDKGYILHNGVLKSYELLEISICFSTDIIRYKCLIGGKEERLCEAPMTYRSEEDFKNGNEFGHNSVTLGDVTISALGFKGIDTAFTCKDGKVNRVYVKELIYVWSDYQWRSRIRCYRSEKELCRWNDITITEEDGSMRVLHSIAGLVAVKPEQQVIVDELKDALKRAEEAGLMVISDYECCELRVIDRSMIQEVALLYDGEETNEECEVEIDPAMMQKIYNISMYDYGGNQRFVARSRK